MSNDQILEMGATKPPVPCDHFPTTWQPVIWRNYGIVPVDRIAKALGTTPKTIIDEAKRMGLEFDDSLVNTWLNRGYQTIIRQNWHLLSYDQILTLLQWTEEKLAFILREDDFFWHKLGSQKPTVQEPKFAPLTQQQLEKTKRIREAHEKITREQAPETEKPFGFLQSIGKNAGPANNKKPGLKMLYSYSALYGDPLIDKSLDPFPDNMLDAYAESGVNALWMQAVLYSLVPWFGDTPYSEGYKTRLDNLRDLAKRMAARGIKLMLYLNEPRAMPEEFFDKHPEWKGVKAREANLWTLCTSHPEVLKLLQDGVTKLFTEVPDLGGLFCITMSENLTNCWSRTNIANPPACPRCAPRGIPPVVADVIDALAKGAWKAKPDAEIIAWSWAWAKPWCQELVAMLPKGVKLQCVSETAVQTFVGGYKGQVVDYSMSKPGPGPLAKEMWALARESDIPVVAKVQLNCTWENSAVPYIPVPGLVEEHLDNLKAEGVNDLMLSWTLGGYPGGNIRLLTKRKEELAKQDFGEKAATTILKAYDLFDQAFRHFPFNGTATIYTGPQNYGPHAQLYIKPTGYHGSMIGFPYDDLTTWRGNFYPEDVFENEFKILSDTWKQGLELVENAKDQVPKGKLHNYQDLVSVARTCYCHFRSTYNQIHFVRQRNVNNIDEAKAVAKDEIKLALNLLDYIRQDSRLGFEASNHYYYTQNSLKEKVLNCLEILGKL